MMQYRLDLTMISKTDHLHYKSTNFLKINLSFTRKASICVSFWYRFRKMESQEGLDVHLQGRAGHGQLEAVDDVWVEHSEAPHALSTDEDFCTATREKGGIWKKGETLLSKKEMTRRNVLERKVCTENVTDDHFLIWLIKVPSKCWNKNTLVKVKHICSLCSETQAQTWERLVKR